MSTFTTTIPGIVGGNRVFPMMLPTNGTGLTATLSTVNASTETLTVAIDWWDGAAWQTLLQQGPTGGINSITVSPTANKGVGTLYIAAIACSTTTPVNLVITVASGSIIGLGRVRRSGVWVPKMGADRRSGVWTPSPAGAQNPLGGRVRRSGAWNYTTF